MKPVARYPASRRDATADIYHGVRVPDPYRWLEDPHSPETIQWTEEQNALTRQVLDGPLREDLAARLRQLYDYPRASAPVRRHSRYFFTRNAGLEDQPPLYVQDGLEGQPRLLLDPNVLSADGTVALTAFEPSHDGRYLAYALSRHGSDRQDVYVREVDTGVDLADHLRWSKFVTIAWEHEGSAFFYTRFPENETYHPAVYRHVLGRPQADDECVFGPLDDPELVLDVDSTADRGLIVITIHRGASDRSAIALLDVGSRTVRWLIQGFAAGWSFIETDGDALFFRSTASAPRGRIVSIDRTGVQREVVTEGSDILIDARLAGGRLAALYLHNAHSRLALFERDGSPAGDVTLPTLGSVTEMTGEPDGGDLFIRFASFTWPPGIYRCRVADGSIHTAIAPAAHVAPNDFEVRQVWYPSRDGTRVSMFVVHRTGIEVQDGTRPTWLTGYGGFNINRVPDFDPTNILWLERGGVLAVPNLRGGGEYGEAWHEAGMLDCKQNVFDDFIAAAEWLIAERYTTARRLVIEGGSNGGLLVAALLVQRPDLVGAVVCRVPVADMLRYHRFTVGRFWIPEYGCADDPVQFEFLYRYSPLHNVQDGTRYPPMLIMTADTDDRVDPGMARKLAARLQEATSKDGGPILIRIEQRAGHGAGKPVAKLVEEDADIYTFGFCAVVP